MRSAEHTHRTSATRAAAMSPGFTLVELIVVLAILAVLAGLVLPRISGRTDVAKEQTTYASLVGIRDAICGSHAGPGAFADLGEVPAFMHDLFEAPAILASGAPAPAPDPLHGKGWNGPYVLHFTGRYKVDPSRGFTAAYGTDGDAALLDAWRQPIVLQWPQVAGSFDYLQKRVRLVSAGPDGRLETPATVDNPPPAGDDLVLYLFPEGGV